MGRKYKRWIQQVQEIYIKTLQTSHPHILRFETGGKLVYRRNRRDIIRWKCCLVSMIFHATLCGILILLHTFYFITLPSWKLISMYVGGCVLTVESLMEILCLHNFESFPYIYNSLLDLVGTIRGKGKYLWSIFLKVHILK